MTPSLCCASDTLALYRFQLAIFAGVCLVFAVEGTTSYIYSGLGAPIACAVGHLLLAMVDVSARTAAPTSPFRGQH